MYGNNSLGAYGFCSGKEFLQMVYGDNPPEGQFLLYTKPNNKAFAFDIRETDAILATIEEQQKDHTLYFDPCLHKSVPKNDAIVTPENIAVMPGMWLTMVTPQEVTFSLNAMLAGMRIKPVYTIFTGEGLEMFFGFDEPWVFQNKKDWRRAEILLNRFHHTFYWYFEMFGFKLASNSILCHTMRVPRIYGPDEDEKPDILLDGTVTHDDQGNRVSVERVMEFMSARLRLDTILEGEMGRLMAVLKKEDLPKMIQVFNWLFSIMDIEELESWSELQTKLHPSKGDEKIRHMKMQEGYPY
jgi:hypothetical protein